jgi:hypothetical protein
MDLKSKNFLDQDRQTAEEFHSRDDIDLVIPAYILKLKWKIGMCRKIYLASADAAAKFTGNMNVAVRQPLHTHSKAERREASLPG